jgi:PEGA domain-containing protein
MRLTLAAAILVVGLQAVMEAQSSVPVRPSTVSAPLPPIGFPLPQIGFPLPPIGLPLPVDMQPRSDAGPHAKRMPHQHRRSAWREGFRGNVPVIYVVPAYGWGYPLAVEAAVDRRGVPDDSSRPPEQTPLTGRLRLDVQPGGALQLYVDGYYVGTAVDFQSELELAAGPHKIEIRAPGYETLVFDVTIAPNRSITYRDALNVAATKPAAERSVPAPPDLPPAPPGTLYLIPGCYLGNVPPEDAGLPATCDESRVITF